MYIITNTVLGGEYTPSIATTLEEAQQWLLTCTVHNIRNSNDINENMTDEEVIKFAEENLEGFKYNLNHSEIYYGDDSYNIMNIYQILNGEVIDCVHS